MSVRNQNTNIDPLLKCRSIDIATEHHWKITPPPVYGVVDVVIVNIQPRDFARSQPRGNQLQREEIPRFIILVRNLFCVEFKKTGCEAEFPRTGALSFENDYTVC